MKCGLKSMGKSMLSDGLSRQKVLTSAFSFPALFLKMKVSTPTEAVRFPQMGTLILLSSSIRSRVCSDESLRRLANQLPSDKLLSKLSSRDPDAHEPSGFPNLYPNVSPVWMAWVRSSCG